MKYLTETQYSQLVGHCFKKVGSLRGGFRKRAFTTLMIIRLAGEAGLRVSEITELKVADCHIDNNESYIFIKNGKCNKSGSVIISDSLKEMIKLYISYKRQCKELIEEGSSLFSKSNGTTFSRFGIQKKVKSALKDADLPNHFSIHSLRHTFCTQLLRTCNNIRLVQKQARHSSIITTSIYADVMDQDIQHAMNKMEFK